MHRTTGRWKLGLLLSLITAFFWGLLPIALKSLLEGMDPYTITWYRFLSATIVLGIYLHTKGSLLTFERPRGRIFALFLVAILGLCGNYILYLIGLDFISPNPAQVVIQVAPVFLLIGGIFFFQERFDPRQWLGYGILIIGLLLFFNQRLHELFIEPGDYTLGVLFVIAAAVCWAGYALAQKQLLTGYSSGFIMFIIYLGGFVLFSPASRPGTIFELTSSQVILLAFCALNSIIAYGCFAETLNHLEASRVSAVLAIIPLLTVSFMEISVRVFPDFENPDPLNAISVLGALMVVSGSMVSSLSRRGVMTVVK